MNTALVCCTAIAFVVLIIFFRRAALFVARLVLRAVLGLAVIFAVNSCLPHFAIGINLYTAVICSAFGVPGAGMLFIISEMIKVT